MKNMTAYQNIDQYIETFPQKVKETLQRVRETIHAAAPDATEAISYGIPTFKLQGNLVHFGGYEKHVGFYPGAEAIEIFQMELKPYVTSKGTVQFQLDEPIPYDLIKKITKYRVEKSLTKQK